MRGWTWASNPDLSTADSKHYSHNQYLQVILRRGASRTKLHEISFTQTAAREPLTFPLPISVISSIFCISGSGPFIYPGFLGKNIGLTRNGSFSHPSLISLPSPFAYKSRIYPGYVLSISCIGPLLYDSSITTESKPLSCLPWITTLVSYLALSFLSPTHPSSLQLVLHTAARVLF